MKNILIVAAENSAENYGAQVIEEFKKGDPGTRFFGLGGDRFLEKGVDILVHNREVAVLGIIEVLSSIIKLKRCMSLLIREARNRNADAALLIDYPDFNLRLAKKLKKAGIRVYYYISPTVWAWRYSRVKQIKKNIDHTFIIFPFEIDIFEKENISFTYTGHPLVPMIKITEERGAYREKLGLQEKDLVFTLMPGSRRAEIEFLLPEMLKAMELLAREFNIKPFLIRAHSIDRVMIDRFLEGTGGEVTVVEQSDGHNQINASDFVLTTCGTSNLEIAIIGIPFAAVYRLSRLSYMLGIKFVKITNYSIVNILAQEKVVPELIQGQFTAENVYREVKNILEHEEIKGHMLGRFEAIRKILRQEENPPEIIYKKISGDLSNHEQGEVAQ